MAATSQPLSDDSRKPLTGPDVGQAPSTLTWKDSRPAAQRLEAQPPGQGVWARVLARPLISYVTSGKLVKLSVTQSPHLSRGADHSASRVSWGSTELLSPV